MSGVRVDSLIERDGQFVGVRAGDDELYSRVVIAADGVNSFLSRDAGLRGPEPKNNLAVGVKSVIGLDPKVIEERFQVKNGEGQRTRLSVTARKVLGRWVPLHEY